MVSRRLALIAFILVLAHVAEAQLLTGIGSSARGTALDGSAWQTSAQLSTSVRFDSPFATSLFNDAIESRSGTASLTSGSLSTLMATPALHGLRLFGNASVDRDRSMLDQPDARAATVALSYKYDRASGAWVGYQADRFSLPGVSAGLWRQLRNVTVSVASTMRRADLGGRLNTVVIKQLPESTYSDTTGWYHFTQFESKGDSGAPGKKFVWPETEGRIGWSMGPIALDGVVGWRPRLDTVAQHQFWFQAFATAQLARNVGLSLGGGTVTWQLPFVRSQGRFLSVALSLSPSALMRPRSPVPITPSAAGFNVHKSATGEYVVVIHVPQARVVELTGDFNQWHPIRLEQVRPDVWQATLPIGPGTYRMNLRIDGERWIAPPGTVTVDDDFNGRVGLVIVR
jgi:hypothetical protein